MRPSVREFMTDVSELDWAPGPIVEVGARPADGQELETDLRALFPDAPYIGCDVQSGPGVDRIEDIHALSFDDESVGLVLLADTLEHVSDPIRAIEEVHRVLKPGGMVAMTSVMFFVIHAHPWDFWRFTPEGFKRLLEPFESSLVVAQGWAPMPESVFGVGVKSAVELTEGMVPRTAARAQRWGDDRPVDLGPMRMSVKDLWKLTLGSTRDAVKVRLGR